MHMWRFNEILMKSNFVLILQFQFIRINQIDSQVVSDNSLWLMSYLREWSKNDMFFSFCMASPDLSLLSAWESTDPHDLTYLNKLPELEMKKKQ